MDQEIPKGWIKTTLGEITSPRQQRALPSQFAMLPFIGLEHVESQTMKLVSHALGNGARSAAVRFYKGDVLYGKMRPYLNKVWIAEFEGLCSAEFFVFPMVDGLSNEFLATRLNAQDFVDYANSQVSGERPRVNIGKLSQFQILLPPFGEQRRIVAKLRSAFSAVERAEGAARRAGERLNTYRTSVVDAALRGELTEQWRRDSRKALSSGGDRLETLLKSRKDHWEKVELLRYKKSKRLPKYPEPSPLKARGAFDLPPGWIWAGWSQLGFSQNGPSFPSKEYSDEGTKLLRPGNLYADGTVGWTEKNTRYLPDDWIDRRPEFIVRGNELIINLTAQSLKDDFLGRVCLTSEEEYCLLNQRLARLTPITGVQRYFLYLFKSSMFRRFVEKLNSGSLIQHMFTSQLADFAVPLPTNGEQKAIVREIDRRLDAARRLASSLAQQSIRAAMTRQSLLDEAFAGRLVQQDPEETDAAQWLDSLRFDRKNRDVTQPKRRSPRLPSIDVRSEVMQEPLPTAEALKAAWDRIDRTPDARRLFDEAKFLPDQVVSFYEALRSLPELRSAFRQYSRAQTQRRKPAQLSKDDLQKSEGHFRLVELWLENFKNLTDYSIRFDPTQGLDVVLGWNGTGKSNLLEALVVVFRDLNEWRDKNRWPEKPQKAFRLSYQIDGQLVEVSWRPELMRRPEIKAGPITSTPIEQMRFRKVKREDLPLPRFIFGYYSGPTNRLAEHFLPMQQAHYARLREAQSDDASTLTELLEQRKFFCAETHHAKYVLLAFSYKDDPKVREFLQDRLRIVGFESALFVIRKPRWARSGTTADDFWGATGIMRRVMERLHQYAIAPMVLEQNVSYGYRSTTEDHYYFFLPDVESLHAFAAEYESARTFFLALESIDFSELIHDVKIQVRIASANSAEVPITFHQLSEGEQQLLMVLGLMRFTKSHQSLVLLDEPDTHLNPHWSVKYLKDLTQVMSETNLESPEQQSSQILIATHDPLVIASLVKEQIHLLKRDAKTGLCRWERPSVNPRGLGYTGILTSDMFGFRSDLDPETLSDLDSRVRLIAREEALNPQERQQLEAIDQRLIAAGFAKTSSDPYYAAFIRAWGRNYADAMADMPFLTSEDREKIDKIATDVLREAKNEVETKVGG